MSKLYYFFEFFARITLPSVIAVYLIVSIIWANTFIIQVAAVMAFMNVFLGAVLGMYTKRFRVGEDLYDGELAITGNDPDTGIPNLQMTIRRDPNELASKSSILLKSIDQR